MRSQISFYHSKEFQAFGYLNIDNLQNKFKKEFNIFEKGRSKEFFIKHFKNVYNLENFPIWAVVEIISFGNISQFYKLLTNDIKRDVVSEIKDINGFIFENWLHSLSVIRNITAHHSRLWNKTLGVNFIVPKKINIFTDIANSHNKIFFALTVIEYILNSIGEDELEFKLKIKTLLNKYPNTKIKSMGFTEDWQELEIWKN